MIETAFNTLLAILGFGFIIVIHELGHFLAARWAGIRVHAFAVGFGSALFSWRKGLGFRLGSSEAQYKQLVSSARATGSSADGLSPTEYRLNWFPFGGYVKMMGQEDLSPITAATSSDSFSAKPVWKRMIVISAGVVMNLLLAALAFFVAYRTGINEVPPIVGDVVVGSPAQKAGLAPGDRVVSIDGQPASTFNDLVLAAALSGASRPIEFGVQRRGAAAPVSIKLTAERGPQGLYQIGVLPAPGLSLARPSQLRSADDADAYQKALEREGAGALTPGMSLVEVEGVAVQSAQTSAGDAGSSAMIQTAWPLRRALRESGGRAVRATFQDDAGARTSVDISPDPEFQSLRFAIEGDAYATRHLLGLTPVITVENAGGAASKGLQSGDVLARVGSIEWPSTAAGIREIRAHTGKSIDLLVLREGASVPLSVKVDSAGRVGFLAGDTAESSNVLSGPPTTWEAGAPPAVRLSPGIVPGSRLTHVGETPTPTLGAVREALRAQTGQARAQGSSARVTLTLALPSAAGGAAEEISRAEQIELALEPKEVEALHALGWDNARAMDLFNVAEFKDQAANPLEAVGKGLAKTRYVLAMTYVTFARLFDGTVPVSQLNGPVGIAHIGSRVAERGWVYLIFFLGLISANLAVVNFLPLPITDGGHMVFLAIEGITRKPVSVAVQNAATIAGLVLLGTMFLIVTFNDVVRLFG